MHKPLICAFALAGLACTGLAQAQSLTVVNHSFEDITGLTGGPGSEFNFGLPTGWDYYNTTGYNPSEGLYPGTLSYTNGGFNYFNETFPDGDRAAILFLFEENYADHDQEYGFQQVLTDTLLADTIYQLQVDIGNIATDPEPVEFPLDGFPGYRVELLVETSPGVFEVLAMDDNTLAGSPDLEEGEWATSSFTYNSALNPEFVGDNLAIRLVNLNVIDPGNDIEVDFDNVRLSIVPEPTGAALLAGAIGLLALRRQR